MVLVLILLAILILSLILITLIIFSTFQLEVKKLELTNMNKNVQTLENNKPNNQISTQNKSKNNQEQKNNYELVLSLKFANFLTWLRVNLNNKRMHNIYTKLQLEKIDFKKFEQDFKLEDLKVIKKIKFKINSLNLKANIGLESPIITAFSVAILSSLISILLPKVADLKNKNSYYYTILPIYQNKNLYKITLNCIIQVKMVHIINVIFILSKKGKSDKHERSKSTSNRKSYDYSYE